MRPSTHLVFVFLILFLVHGTVFAQELGIRPNTEKTPTSSPENPGTPDGRQGGETMADAFAIDALPFNDTGNTSDNIDNYNDICPWDSTSPDVVYSFFPLEDISLTVDLCGSTYDTKTFIWDSNQNSYGCNDDFYSTGDPCGQYVSKIEDAFLPAGQTYFIIVDGYGGDSGDYILNITGQDPPAPCQVACPAGGMAEGEPPLMDGYVDQFNFGCSSDSGLETFQHLEGTGDESLIFCGTAGWYDTASRDTDWFSVVLGSTGILNWWMDAEQSSYGFLLQPTNCEDVEVTASMLAGPCLPGEMTIQGQPGDLIWLWVGADDFYPPDGFSGHEYPYVCEFEGIADGPVATESLSLDAIKSLYR